MTQSFEKSAATDSALCGPAAMDSTDLATVIASKRKKTLAVICASRAMTMPLICGSSARREEPQEKSGGDRDCVRGAFPRLEHDGTIASAVYDCRHHAAPHGDDGERHDRPEQADREHELEKGAPSDPERNRRQKLHIAAAQLAPREQSRA